MSEELAVPVGNYRVKISVILTVVKILFSLQNSKRMGTRRYFSETVTANPYDIFRQENRAKNREKGAESQKRRFQKAWFWVPAFIFECSKTKTGDFLAGLIF